MSNFEFRTDKLVDEMVQFNQNLSKGVKNLLEADEISAGVTPREEVYAEDKLKLYRYQPSAGVVQNRIPTLIVYALVNRPYMADIQENRSTSLFCWKISLMNWRNASPAWSGLSKIHFSMRMKFLTFFSSLMMSTMETYFCPIN